jgi:hypothetical protein
MWCGGGYLHKECLEMVNAASIPKCCNWKLVGREEPHASNYWGCSHVRDETPQRERLYQTEISRVLQWVVNRVD